VTVTRKAGALAANVDARNSPKTVLLGTAEEQPAVYSGVMFRLIPTMRRGSATALPPASAHYVSIESARLGAAELLREERILKIMIVRDGLQGGYVEWIDR
jgi:expansin (peptidoglycan-binding protein)